MTPDRPVARLLALAGLALALVGLAPGEGAAQPPDGDGSADADPAALTVAGLWAQTTVIHDRFGVPHVYGATDEAACFGLGYAQARDHWQPLLQFVHTANGEAARWFGDVVSPLEPAISLAASGPARPPLRHRDGDELVRLFDVPGHAARELDALPPDVRRCLEVFVLGVNAALATVENRPPWARDLTPTDPLALMHTVALTDALGRIAAECRALRRPEPTTANQCAIAPRYSSTGGAMLLTDLHFEYTGLRQLIEAHVTSPSFEVRGATFIGWPAIVIGFTPHVAWSLAPDPADGADVYRERLDPADPDRYWHPPANGGAGGFARMNVREVRLAVRQPDGALSAEVLRLRTTRHGPVLPQRFVGHAGCHAARVAWFEATNPGSGGLLGQLLALARADSVDAFRAAIARQPLPLGSVMAAFASGDILYAMHAACAARPPGLDTTRPLPGDTVDGDWRGLVPAGSQPQRLNPASGWIQNCNGHPTHATDGDAPIDTAAWLAPAIDTARSQRLAALLRDAITAGPVHPDTLTGWATDAHVSVAARIVPGILAAARIDPPIHPQVVAGLHELAAWDMQARAGSVAAAHFLTWLARHGDRIERMDNATRLRSWADHLRDFASDYGNGRADVPWGDLHGIARNGEWIGTSGATGIAGTLRAGVWGGIRRPSPAGSTFTQVVVFGADGRARARSAVPFGASSNPRSPHHLDQARALTAHDRLKPAWLAPMDVARNAGAFVSGRTVRLHLEPGAPPVRIVPPWAETDDHTPLVHGIVRQIGVHPLIWRPTRAQGTTMIRLDSDGGRVYLPEMQPGVYGRPMYGVDDYYGVNWRTANGNGVTFSPGFERRVFWGLYRRAATDPEENY